ncbi:MAG: FAD-dependent oxidoreductase [Thermodesulfovibrionales bacterium]
MGKKEDAFLTEEAKKHLLKELELLRGPVTVVALLSDTENQPFNVYCRKLLHELSALSPKIIPVFAAPGDATAKKYNVSRTPTLLVQPDRYAIRFTGAPAGEEAQTFLLSLIMSSIGQTILSEQAKKRLSELTEVRNIKVFVSPTCPYCPLQALLGVAAAIEKADLISTEIIEIHENKDLAKKYNAFSVPQVFIDDRLVGLGLQPEEVFIEEIMSAAPIKASVYAGSDQTDKDLVIIGAGPAGLTAAIYAVRSGLNSVVLEKGTVGGQVAITPVVENYPGFTRIGGKALMDMMAQQAIQYSEIHQGEEVLETERKDDLFHIKTNRAVYKTKAVLLTTGAESKKLDIPGEKEFQGKGVSYCASCDGYFFKDNKKVIVVGGGNTAATEALYLKNIGADVTLILRKNALRAERFLQENLTAAKVPVLRDTIVREIRGDGSVSSVLLKDLAAGTETVLPVDAVFIAIGYTPNNLLAEKLGVETDEEGYIRVDKEYRTSVKRVYAAGDITGGFKQIVTAVGQAAVAAQAIFEEISAPYWKEKT